MSNQDRIRDDIRLLSEELLQIDDEVDDIEDQLTNPDLSSDDKARLEGFLETILQDRYDVRADIAMLEEDLVNIAKSTYQDEPDTGAGCGLDWNESGYFD
jgi:t-SNARE complex subunit (syntaxin)